MMMMDTTSGEQAGPLDSSPRAGDVPAIAATFTVVKMDEAHTEAMDAEEESNNNHILDVHEYKEHRKSKKKKRDKRDKERRSEKHHRREREGGEHHHHRHRRHRDRERERDYDEQLQHQHHQHHHPHAHVNHQHSTSASSSPSSSASSFLSATISNEYIAVSPASSSPCCSVVSGVSCNTAMVTATTATAMSYPHNLKIRFLLSGLTTAGQRHHNRLRTALTHHHQPQQQQQQAMLTSSPIHQHHATPRTCN
ncbi:unnamed protein product [Ceratitis capitata]|uniref:(Mediterranean fruit fly) hypothetical protein n=1 Tax=Ceratitis capitata TaxID=7213 RepID=A0A811U2T3_CERCA|nr:unnamed protein product [Ceratitis capitata]